MGVEKFFLAIWLTLLLSNIKKDFKGLEMDYVPPEKRG